MQTKTIKNIFICSTLATVIPFSSQAAKLVGSEQLNTVGTLTNIDETKCRPTITAEEWLDQTRNSTYKGLCNTVKWFDGLFGDDHEFDDSDFRGKVVVGYRHDEADGFDPKVRVRIKTKLPNVSSRLNAFIGRVEEDEYISDSEVVKQDSITAVGLRSNDSEDADWLIGLGYKNPKNRRSGFDYSVGAKISSGLNPYVKARHRHSFQLSEPHFLRTTQTLFWKNEDGFGFSSGLNYSYIHSIKDIIQAGARIKYTEDEEQWEWITSGTWHHSLSDTRGISSRIYVRGEEKNPVSIPEYGINLTYRRPFLRDWLFLELGVDFRWEKEFEDDDYESVVRYGIQTEMVFGDYYGRNRKSRITQPSND